MRFFLPLLSLAAALGAASATTSEHVARQEAARFGSVTVSPSSVRFDQVRALLYLYSILLLTSSAPAHNRQVQLEHRTQQAYCCRFLHLGQVRKRVRSARLHARAYGGHAEHLLCGVSANCAFRLSGVDASRLLIHAFAQLPILYASDTNGYQENTTWLLWAILTYPESTSGALERGGTSAPLQILLQ